MLLNCTSEFINIFGIYYIIQYFIGIYYIIQLFDLKTVYFSVLFEHFSVIPRILTFLHTVFFLIAKSQIVHLPRQRTLVTFFSFRIERFVRKICSQSFFKFCLATEVNLSMKVIGYIGYIFDEQYFIMSQTLYR